MHNKQGPEIPPPQSNGGNNKQWNNNDITTTLEISAEVTWGLN